MVLPKLWQGVQKLMQDFKEINYLESIFVKSIPCNTNASNKFTPFSLAKHSQAHNSIQQIFILHVFCFQSFTLIGSTKPDASLSLDASKFFWSFCGSWGRNGMAGVPHINNIPWWLRRIECYKIWFSRVTKVLLIPQWTKSKSRKLEFKY